MTYALAEFEVATSNILVDDAFTTKKHNLTFDLNLGFKVISVLPSTLSIMRPIHLQSLKVVCRRVKEEIHLQENTVFDI